MDRVSHQPDPYTTAPWKPQRIAVVIPCLNEEPTVGRVVADFARVLPDARVYVFDNGSTDRTADAARQAGATVIHSPRRGKGNVIRQVANTVSADVYLFVDGDDTYPADAAPELLRRFHDEGADMLVATRLGSYDESAFRLFHRLGNRLIAGIISGLFSTRVSDVLSGYRLLSADFMRVLCVRSEKFEIEAELTLQALAKGFVIREVPISYGSRPTGSESKLNTWSDGFLIIKCVVLLFKDYKPFMFFGWLAAALALASLAAGSAPLVDFYRFGYVFHVPRAILAAGLGILAAIVFGVGLLLDSIAQYHLETIELLRRSLRR
jgi:glycosyltransferase involved in cell wall biosynthesis